MSRAKAIILVIGLGAGQLPPGGRAAAQNKARSYVQVTEVSKSAEPLHLASKEASCGTATVHVYALKVNTPDPFVTIELDQYSSSNPGVTVNISPESQSTKIASSSSFTTLNFKFCAAGKTTGTATLQAAIQSVGPDRVYEIKQPEPAETARVIVDVVN